ncbi:heavy-metal-associated domain-containing protein [bacterium]|jgi:copper chaperone CopZ|nr:heavy-metal-associated domain-containing protein [bacterium]
MNNTVKRLIPIALIALVVLGGLIFWEQPSQINMADLDSITIKVTGMTCVSCDNKVNKSISKLPGVQAVDIDRKEEKVIIHHRKGAAHVQTYMDAINALGYKASLVDKGNGKIEVLQFKMTYK